MSADAELLTAYARRGDVQSLSALVVRHSPWMSAMLRAMLPSGEVEDALQDIWLKVIRSAHGFRGNGLKSYLGSITRSVAVDRLRKCGRTVSLDAGDEADDDSRQMPVDESPTPDVRFESSATKEEIHRVIGTLAEGPRQVLLLRIEAEMSFREIADELHVPLGTALTWMRTATLRLKEALGGDL